MSRGFWPSDCRGDDFAIPLDRHGSVVYFKVRGQSFFFNGHTGFFCDTLPEYAERAFAALSLPESERGQEWSSLKAGYGAECLSLLNEMALFQRGCHPDLKPQPRQKRFPSERIPSNIQIYVSQSCNLACAYCENQGGTFGLAPAFMSAECAGDVLGFVTNIVKEEAHRIITVVLFGGEPLLNPKAVHILCRGIQDLNHSRLSTKIRLILGTNGTIYSKGIFNILMERPELSSVSLSLDGIKDIHDRNRPFRRSKLSSYDCILGNLKRMIRDNIPSCVTCVITDPLDYVTAARELYKVGVRCLALQALSYHIFGTSRLPPAFHYGFEDWKRTYLEYADFHLDYLAGPNLVEHVDRAILVQDYAKKLAGPDRLPSNLACPAGDSHIAIDSEGRIFPCLGFLGREPLCLGDVRVGFDQRRYLEFENWLLSDGQHSVDNERCRNCFAKIFCGGGCYARSFDMTGDLRPLNESQCRLVRETVKIDLYYLSQMKKRGLRIKPRLTDVEA